MARNSLCGVWVIWFESLVLLGCVASLDRIPCKVNEHCPQNRPYCNGDGDGGGGFCAKTGRDASFDGGDSGVTGDASAPGADGGGCTSTGCDGGTVDGGVSVTCPSGYAGTDCADVDECATGADTCDHDPQACANTAGRFSCGCPSGFSGNGQGPTGCLLTDANLLRLLPSVGTLSPDFVQSTTTYNLTLPAGTTSASLTPFIAYPTHATIRVDGEAVASGTDSASLQVGLPPRAVSVTVTTEAGQSRSYTVVLRRSPPTYIKASNTGAGDALGSTVALSADGTTLAVGAYSEASGATGVHADTFGQGDNSAEYAGAVYVFTRTGTTWSQQAYVKASNAGANDLFGSSVALSADGATLAVGAYGEASGATGVRADNSGQSDEGAPSSGAVYVFTRTGTTWAQRAYVKASRTGAGDAFGGNVALSADGTTLAVGASGEDSSATGVHSDGSGQSNDSAPGAGAVYVFTRAGTTWTQQAYVKASNTGAGDAFGYDLALSADGTMLAVGALEEDSVVAGVHTDTSGQSDESAPGSGAVYVFTRTGTTWTQRAYVKASNAGAGDAFGASVALSGDGRTLAVGASGEASSAIGVHTGSLGQSDDSTSRAGAVYVFTRTGTTWAQQSYVKASNTGPRDFFGSEVALSADGTTLVVGAYGEASSATGVHADGFGQSDDSASRAGAGYVFTRAETTWTQQAYVKASDTDALDRFGFSVALSADGLTLAVGAFGEASIATGVYADGSAPNDNSASGAGVVYVF